MSQIKITDLPKDKKISRDEMATVMAGYQGSVRGVAQYLRSSGILQSMVYRPFGRPGKPFIDVGQ